MCCYVFLLSILARGVSVVSRSAVPSSNNVVTPTNTYSIHSYIHVRTYIYYLAPELIYSLYTIATGTAIRVDIILYTCINFVWMISPEED